MKDLYTRTMEIVSDARPIGDPDEKYERITKLVNEEFKENSYAQRLASGDSIADTINHDLMLRLDVKNGHLTRENYNRLVMEAAQVLKSLGERKIEMFPRLKDWYVAFSLAAGTTVGIGAHSLGIDTVPSLIMGFASASVLYAFGNMYKKPTTGLTEKERGELGVIDYFYENARKYISSQANEEGKGG